LRKAIANRQIQLAELGYVQFRAALTARARRLGLAVVSAEVRSAAAQEVADRAKQLAAVMVQRDPAGITPLLETRILEATAVTSLHRAADSQKELQSAMTEINQLRGYPVQQQVRIATPDLKFPSTPPLDEVLASARTNNFELKMREVELEQQGFKVQLAKNERYPSVTAGPFYSEEKARDFETRVGVGVSVPIPIWNRNKGNIEVASARRTQAETSLLVSQREIEKRVVQAVTTYQAALGQLTQWPTNAVEHFQEAAELGDRHYRLGAIPISTYIELQKQYLDAIEAILNTESEADDARQQMALLAGWIHEPSSPSTPGEHSRAQP
jgi:cobalt-zinc-cadmium efflux system outer membrane protein